MPGHPRPPLDLADVTVSINVVDREDYLVACVRSLLETTPVGPRLNLLFNGSDDEMIRRIERVLADWPGPTSTIVLPETLPLWHSHQIALDAIETQLVNFMGDDDIVLAERLPRIIDTFNDTSPVPGAVTTFAKRIGPTIDPLRFGSNKDLGPSTIAEWSELREAGAMFEMNFSGAVFRTEAVRAAGGFSEAFTETVDNRLFTVIGSSHPVLALPERSFGYRIHPNSVSSTRFLSQAEAVRHVAACAKAARDGEPEPTRAEFAAEEQRQPWVRRMARNQSTRSQMYFRRGAAEILSGRRAHGVTMVVLSFLASPVQFARTLGNQRGRPLQ